MGGRSLVGGKWLPCIPFMISWRKLVGGSLSAAAFLFFNFLTWMDKGGS